MRCRSGLKKSSEEPQWKAVGECHNAKMPKSRSAAKPGAKSSGIRETVTGHK